MLLFFCVSIYLHRNAEPGKPMFDWRAAPSLVHQLAPVAMILGVVWLWFWRGKLRGAANEGARLTGTLIMCAGLEALALGGVVVFFLTRDPILAAWAAPAFFIAVLTDPPSQS